MVLLDIRSGSAMLQGVIAGELSKNCRPVYFDIYADIWMQVRWAVRQSIFESGVYEQMLEELGYEA